jgi:maltose alpha-D-glucosyltransferase/alpha-amylase
MTIRRLSVISLPVSFIEASQSNAIAPVGIISLAYINEKRGFVIDALYDERFQQALFYQISHAESVYQQDGKVDFVRGKGLSGERHQCSYYFKGINLIIFQLGNGFWRKYFLKLYRKLFKETNPEVEMIEF